MKKIFSVFLAVGMMVSFVGCGGEAETKKTTPAPSSGSDKKVETPKK